MGEKATAAGCRFSLCDASGFQVIVNDRIVWDQGYLSKVEMEGQGGGLQLSLEGEGLQGGEQVVELIEVGTAAGFLGFDRFDDGGEALLEVEGGDWCVITCELPSIEFRNVRSTGKSCHVVKKCITSKEHDQEFFI